jgi:hypothetical protein
MENFYGITSAYPKTIPLETEDPEIVEEDRSEIFQTPKNIIDKFGSVIDK